jgi:ankyrin repeat protein
LNNFLHIHCADTREQIRAAKHAELREAVAINDQCLVSTLLKNVGPEREIIVNMAPAGANTLLFTAAQLGNESILSMLLEAGADGRAHAVTRYSPLYTAVHHGHTKVAKILLEKFPSLVQHVTVEKWLPFHAACINGHNNLVEMMLKHDYPEELMSTYRDVTGEWEYRLAFDPNSQDVTGQTALYVTCLLGNKPLVELLLNWKVKCWRITNDAKTGDPTAHASKTQSNAQQISPTKKRISYGIQSIMSRLSLGKDPSEVSAQNSTNSDLLKLKFDFRKPPLKAIATL